METIDYIRSVMEDVHRMLGQAMTDLTDETAHWRPGGTANAIAPILTHAVSAEDFAVNWSIRGGRSLLDAEGWCARTNIPEVRTQIWEPGWRLNLPAFDEYRLAVQASAVECLSQLTEADLQRDVPWFRDATFKLDRLVRVVMTSHIFGHCGEVSAIKGMQGLKGLPI